jgi:anti-sigma B factor antagonist
MQLSSYGIEGAQVVRVEEDRIDAAVAIQFKERMREIAQGGRIILDLNRVVFVDSSGLGAIVAVMKFLAPAGKLELAALTPNVGKVFHMTRMDSVFTIHPVAPGRGQDHAA